MQEQLQASLQRLAKDTPDARLALSIFARIHIVYLMPQSATMARAGSAVRVGSVRSGSSIKDANFMLSNML